MRRAEFMDIHVQVWIFAQKRARRAGMIQMNVRQQEGIDALERPASLFQPRTKRPECGLGARINDCAFVGGFNQKRRDRLRPARPIQVDRRKSCHRVSSLSIFSRASSGLGKSCRCKDLLAESWELGIRYWHRALSF